MNGHDANHILANRGGGLGVELPVGQVLQILDELAYAVTPGRREIRGVALQRSQHGHAMPAAGQRPRKKLERALTIDGSQQRRQLEIAGRDAPAVKLPECGGRLCLQRRIAAAFAIDFGGDGVVQPR